MSNPDEAYSLPVSDIGESMVYKPPKPPVVPVAEEQLQAYVCDVPEPPTPSPVPDPFKLST